MLVAKYDTIMKTIDYNNSTTPISDSLINLLSDNYVIINDNDLFDNNMTFIYDNVNSETLRKLKE